MLFPGGNFIVAGRQFDLERAEGTARSEREYPETGKKSAENRSKARRQRSVRFSDSGWNLIWQAAARHGMSPGELVRSSTVAAAENRLGEPPPATLSKGHAALIGEIWHFIHVMAMLDREEMLETERGAKLSDLVAATRKSMAGTMDKIPVSRRERIARQGRLWHGAPGVGESHDRTGKMRRRVECRAEGPGEACDRMGPVADRGEDVRRSCRRTVCR